MFNINLLYFPYEHLIKFGLSKAPLFLYGCLTKDAPNTFLWILDMILFLSPVLLEFYVCKFSIQFQYDPFKI